jgi:hypothetical protein
VGVVRGVAATKVLAWWWRCDDATTAKTTERGWVSGSLKMKMGKRNVPLMKMLGTVL